MLRLDQRIEVLMAFRTFSNTKTARSTPKVLKRRNLKHARPRCVWVQDVTLNLFRKTEMKIFRANKLRHAAELNVICTYNIKFSARYFSHQSHVKFVWLRFVKLRSLMPFERNEKKKTCITYMLLTLFNNNCTYIHLYVYWMRRLTGIPANLTAC